MIHSIFSNIPLGRLARENSTSATRNTTILDIQRWTHYWKQTCSEKYQNYHTHFRKRQSPEANPLWISWCYQMSVTCQRNSLLARHNQKHWGYGTKLWNMPKIQCQQPLVQTREQSWTWSSSNPLDKTCHGYIHILQWELPNGCGLYLQVSNNPQVAIHDSQSSDRYNEIHNLWGRSSSYHCQWQWPMLCLRILQTGKVDAQHSAHNNFASLPPEQWVCWSLCQNLQGILQKAKDAGEDPHLVMMIYHKTQLGPNQKSPIEIFCGKKTHSDLPVANAALKAKGLVE